MPLSSESMSRDVPGSNSSSFLGFRHGKGRSCDHLEEPASELFANARNFFHFVPLSGGGCADPRWTTTLLTAFDSRSEARVLELEA